MFKPFKKKVGGGMRSVLNVSNLEVEKPNLSKLACKHSARVVVSSFV